MSETQGLPERLYCYQSFITDGARWDHFVHRPGDVFVCTLGKNGTTWMQAICALLIFRTPELDFNPGVRSPWFDSTFGRLRGRFRRTIGEPNEIEKLLSRPLRRSAQIDQQVAPRRRTAPAR